MTDGIKFLAMSLADKCREKGLNFVIAIEDGEIFSQHSVTGNSPLNELAKILAVIIKK